MTDFVEIIKKYIQISQPLIYIRGNDELRVKSELESFCKNLLIKDYIDLCENGIGVNQGIINLFDDYKSKETVIFISNGTGILREPEMISFIRKIAIENLKISVIVMADAVDIPTILSPYSVTINLPSQTTEEIIQFLTKEGFFVSVYSQSQIKEFANRLKGLSCFEIRQLVRRKNNGEKLKELVKNLNDGISSNNEFISFIEVSDEEKLGGFDKLKEKINGSGKNDGEKNIFNNIDDAKRNNVPIPKGYMLVGIPGCGKSLAAKVTAREFGIPLLKMEFGKIMNKYVGESEANLFYALRFAEEYAPCVLWLDEFEKSIISSSDGGSDGNISNRLLGIFLNWLQEKTAPVYVVATVNNIDKMPPELLRRGRFDEIYKVELPKPSTVRNIMDIQFEKYHIDKNSLDKRALKNFCDELGDAYSGADIEELVKSAKRLAFCRKKSVSMDELRIAQKEVQPVDIIMHEQIQKIKEVFSKYNFKPVE